MPTQEEVVDAVSLFMSYLVQNDAFAIDSVFVLVATHHDNGVMAQGQLRLPGGAKIDTGEVEIPVPSP